ncbi:MAG: ABC transporter permease subunit [Anaerolineae bacterium]|nr:ABC transporter permease subunit [Anaerolineae bacterium]NUQ04489.1 ABC transporter permease subunit [Anaerolineae bacterium]
MRNNRDRYIAFVMLLPSLILVGIFVYGFIGQAIQTSMTDWGQNPAQPPLAATVIKSFVGLQNYENIMTDTLEFYFRNALVNTFFFTVLFVLGCVAAGMILALLLDQKVVGEGFFRTIFLFPMALSFVVTGTIWRWMLQPGGGVNILPQVLFGLPPIEFSWINSRDVWLPFEWGNVPAYLTMAGIAILAFLAVRYASARRWRASRYAVLAAVIVLLVFAARLWDFVWLPLDTPEAETPIAPKGFNAALVGIIIAAVWQMSGYTMAMFIAGIRGVPEELREAARVDGCSELDVYRRIVLPQLNPIILSAMIILGHISLKIFDLVFAMAGPDNAKAVVPGLLVYTEGFRENAFAKASAIAVIMLFFVTLIIVPYLWSQLRESRSRGR